MESRSMDMLGLRFGYRDTPELGVSSLHLFVDPSGGNGGEGTPGSGRADSPGGSTSRLRGERDARMWDWPGDGDSLIGGAPTKCCYKSPPPPYS